MKKVLLLGLLMSLVGCVEPEKPISIKKTQAENKSDPSNNTFVIKEIDPLIFTSYNRENFPRTYEVWGVDGIKRIEQLERDAAFKISTEQNNCNYIEMVALSENKSNPKKEAVVFIDCANRERFYISENDITNHVFIDLKIKHPINEIDASKQCLELVKQLKNDTSINEAKILDSTGFKGKSAMTSAVSIKYLSDGVEKRARCTYDFTGKKIIQFID
ncbi:hypothetical protein [Acinetobacter sp. 251-1]|uniref:hypothetical protein n=1 Tax=Acinetobacter sp. 251-1 TaxID=2746720 RepID=UPI0025778A3C|nr:hypothetical protein [Acinetobacter sp. 251-1]MDM1760707.1 hypothetical protein [Acinetobacter sp. 251-1]